MNKAQTDISYGFTTIARTDPSYYAYWLMNHVLGQYSMSGRLGESIRERQGMAYYVYSTLDANVVEGPLLVRAGVSPANVDRTIASIDDEIRSVAAARSDGRRAGRLAPLSRRTRCRARSRRMPASRTFCRPPSSSASGSTTTCGCRPARAR